MALPVFVTVQDAALLSPGVSVEAAEAMIRAVTARAVAVAPCIAGDALSEAQTELVRAIILDAVSRWSASGGGSVQSQTAGPFGYTVDTRQDRKGTFLRSEFDDLQAVCDDLRGASREAFSITLGGGRIAARADGVSRNRDYIDYGIARSRGWIE